MHDTEIAPARIITTHIDRRSGVRQVAVECPYCRNRRTGKPNVHFHGWPLDGQPPGVRLAHCAGDDARGRSYRLVVDEKASA